MSTVNKYANFQRHVTVPNFSSTSRNQGFHERFATALNQLKRKHGYGVYSWAEGMTRKVARRIAQTIARLREQRNA